MVDQYIPELQLPSRSCYTGIPGFYAAHRAVLQSGRLANPLSPHPCSWEDGISGPGGKENLYSYDKLTKTNMETAVTSVFLVGTGQALNSFVCVSGCHLGVKKRTRLGQEIILQPHPYSLGCFFFTQTRPPLVSESKMALAACSK